MTARMWQVYEAAQEINRLDDENERLREAARLLWAALVAEWRAYDEVNDLTGDVIRKYQHEFGTDDVIAVLRGGGK